jgi:hypothetical protein
MSVRLPNILTEVSRGFLQSKANTAVVPCTFCSSITKDDRRTESRTNFFQRGHYLSKGYKPENCPGFESR